MTEKKTTLEWKRLFESEEFEKEYFYKGNDLGVTLTEKETIFKVWAPTAEKITLKLYQSGEKAEEPVRTCLMEKTEQGVWEASFE